MRYFLFYLVFFFSNCVLAQKYDNLWKNVYTLELDGKYKSANEEVDKIYIQAQKNLNKEQLVRALLYQSKYILLLEEKGQDKVIQNLQNEINNTSGIHQSLLNYIYAKSLSKYLAQNGWKLSRTSDEAPSVTNFASWAYQIFESKIKEAYLASLKDKNVLISTSISQYPELFVSGIESEISDYSLYDFLMSEYIDFMTPNYYTKIHIEDQLLEAMLSHPETFIKSDFSSVKSGDFFGLLQEIESMYLTQNQKKDLERIWLKRLNLLEQIPISKKENYLKAYQLFTAHCQVPYFKTEAQWKQAQIYHSLASKEVYPDYNQKALVLLDSILAARNYSYTYLDGEDLRKKITEQSIELSLVKNLYENESSRAFIRHKNIDTLYINIYKVSNSLVYERYSNINDSITKEAIQNQLPEKTIKYALENKKDYFTYTTEVLLPKFEQGKYLLVFGDPISNKDKSNSRIRSIPFRVSNIYLNYIQQDNKVEFLVLDRKTGEPISGATVIFDKLKGITNKNGEVIIKSPKTKYGTQVSVSVNYNDDYLDTSIYNYWNDYTDDEEENEWRVKSKIYTDRSIYRPGQTIYYKGIVFQNKNRKTSTVKDIYITLKIDNNEKTLQEKRIKTNEFGSFSGEFIIPKNIITGDLNISILEDYEPELDKKYNHQKEEHPLWDNIDYFDEAYTNVKVEEYKRPTFEVIFDKEIKDYVINDTIVITGKAKSFSGTIVSNAKVNYSVTRTVNYTNPRIPHTYFGSEEITFGEITADKDGSFTIKFHAIADKTADIKELPIFNFSIKADITDTQGETRSSSKTIHLGYHNLKLSASVPQEVTVNKPLDVPVYATNLNGTNTSTNIHAKIYKKTLVSKTYKRRLFEVPEIQTIPREEFEALFPYEPYTLNKEDDTYELVYEETFHSDNKQKITLDNLEKWSSGSYKLVLSSIDSKSGEEVNSERKFEIKNPKINPSKTLFTFQKLNSDYKKDKEIQYQLLSSLNQPLSVLVKAYHKNQQVYKTRVDLNQLSYISIPVNKNWDNQLYVEFFFAWENMDFKETDNVSFYPENYSLEAEIISMKNLLEPGSAQTWSFRIKDKSQKGVNAEVLASMYDMSLDDFYYSPWKTNSYFYYDDYYYTNFHISNHNNIRKESLYFLHNNTFFKRKSFRSSFNFYGYNFATKSNDFNYIQFIKKIIDSPSDMDNAQVFRGIVLAAKDGLPLPGATVFNSTKKTYTSTDLDGKFKIKASEKDVLIISSIAMMDARIEVNSSLLTGEEMIYLYTTNEALDEVVVAYGAVTKQAFTGAVLMSADDKLGLNLIGVTGLDMEDGATIRIRGTSSLANSLTPLYVVDGRPLTPEEALEINTSDITDFTILKDASATALYGSRGANGVVIITTKNAANELANVKTRKNLNETAFFYPHIRTDKKGNLSFDFNSPEALSSWRLRLLSHTKNMTVGYFDHVVVTQKELMIQPNIPRFLRETDTVYIKAKVSNLSQEVHSGMAMLEFTNISDNKTITISEAIQTFRTEPKGNQTLTWKVIIPKGTSGIEYKISAKAGNFTDGETGIIPVLSNRIFVTESIPIWVREKSQKDFVMEKLTLPSATRQNQSLTIDYTSNPTWIAIGALPYLMEYEHDCSEQVFSKYYANIVASHILESNPTIKKVLEKWSQNPTSKLDENPEIKSILLSETPWVLDAKSMEEQKKNLSSLMDLQSVKTSSDKIFQQLSEKQKSSGGFGWFESSPENIFITTHITTGLGQLKKMRVDSLYIQKFEPMAYKAINFLDKKFMENHPKPVNKSLLINPYEQLNYLYARSFYPELKIEDSLQQKINFYLNHYKENWLNLSLYEKTLLSVVLYRNADSLMAQKIVEHFKESSVTNTNHGMYWLENTSSPYWYKSPIETQALLIEAFNEITPYYTKSIEEMKVWLIKQKQTKHWNTTKSTMLAINALLTGQNNFISHKNTTSFKVGKQVIKTQNSETAKTEAEAGYFKFSWTGEQITPEFAQVTIDNSSESVGYGGIFWSYFEELDNISASQSDLMSVRKELYLKKQNGNEVVKIYPNTKLKLGDLVTILLVVSSSEDIDFVHLKDVRASGFEPVDVLSEYEYQNGLYYYKSTKDVATHFFFDSLRKGTYVLEYDVRVNNLGNFANGITTIQSMYAPEYSSHTSSVRVSAEE